MSHQVQRSSAASHCRAAFLDPAVHVGEPPRPQPMAAVPTGHAPDAVTPEKSDLHGQLYLSRWRLPVSPKSGTAGPIRTVPAFHLLRIHDAQGRVGEDRGMAGLGVELMSTTVSGLGAVAVILAIKNEGLPPTFFVRISENTTSAAVRIAVGEPHPLAQSERVPPSVRRLGVGRRKVGHRGRDVGTLVAQQRVVQRAIDQEPGGLEHAGRIEGHEHERGLDHQS